MNRPAVRVEGLGKKFAIGVERQRRLSQQVGYWVRGHQPTRNFWALRNVSFDLAPGESLGVIGPNGSGKSTLLRIIAGILQPNEGRVETYGRINPFLSLGVGLLPQLTVLENLRLTAALLGFTAREFEKKLDAIVEFSGLRDYLYAAVADLSTGWAARVAFSIAIHTDLNILLVDETLEVGDAYFRKKCRAAFERIRAEGKTVVLISHDMNDILSNCDQALYIDGGRVVEYGAAAAVAKRYQADVRARVGSEG